MRVYGPDPVVFAETTKTTMREGSGREVMVKKEEEEAGGGSSGGSGRPIVPSKAAILNRVRWAMLGRRMSRIDEAEGRALAAATTAEDEDEIGRPGVDREDGTVAVVAPNIVNSAYLAPETDPALMTDLFRRERERETAPRRIGEPAILPRSPGIFRGRREGTRRRTTTTSIVVVVGRGRGPDLGRVPAHPPPL